MFPVRINITGRWPGPHPCTAWVKNQLADTLIERCSKKSTRSRQPLNSIRLILCYLHIVQFLHNKVDFKPTLCRGGGSPPPEIKWPAIPHDEPFTRNRGLAQPVSHVGCKTSICGIGKHKHAVLCLCRPIQQIRTTTIIAND